MRFSKRLEDTLIFEGNIIILKLFAILISKNPASNGDVALEMGFSRQQIFGFGKLLVSAFENNEGIFAKNVAAIIF